MKKSIRMIKLEIRFNEAIFEIRFWVTCFPSHMFMSKGKRVLATIEIEKALRERGIEPNDDAYRNPCNWWTIGSAANRIYRIT